MKTSPNSHVRISLAWIGAALAVVCLAGPARAGATTFPPMSPAPGQTVVSIEFDDATADQIAARPLLAAHNMKATFFINSGNLVNSYHMTWSQIHELYSDGNEIAGHTTNHPHLTQLSTEEATRQICNDRVTLLNQGFQPTDFAFPFGDYNSTVRSIPQQCGYNSARDVNGVRSPSCEEESCPFAESIPPADPYLTRTPRNILVTDTLANIEGYVTQAQQNGGGWVQLVFHHICNECETYAITESNFSALLDWLATQKNTSTATVQQVIGGPLQSAVAGPAPVNLPGPNLLHNPSLEEESPFNHGVPAGWETTSFGTNTATFSRTTDAHSGNQAEHLEVSNFQSGAARLLSKMDLGEYAPTPTVGDNYDLGEYYKSNVPVLFYIYTRDQTGAWNWWTNSGLLPASSGWTKATYTTPPIPAGVTGISVGLGIQQAGSLTVDDPSLVDRGAIPPASNVLQNPSLDALSGGVPVCWSPVVGGGSTLTGTWSNTTDAHTGTSAELASVSSYTSGDMKLISQQDATLANPTLTSAIASATGGQLAAGSHYYEVTATTKYGETLPSNELGATTSGATGSVALKWPALTSASVTGYKIYRASLSGQETLLATVASTATSYTDAGSASPGSSTPPASNTASKVSPCAPSTVPGDTYTGSAWYKSSSGASVRLIVYYRDATGNWVFWKSQPVPASTTWTQATVVTEALPPGATALSFGVSLYSAGTLTADDLSLGDATAASASDPPPCGADVCDTTPPASSASSPAYSTSQALSVSYAAADNPGGSGLVRVDLYVKGPGDLGYTLAASNPGYATSGVFAYAALEGDGTYSFYTIATDKAGNSETAPLSSETTTVVDTTPPTSTASAPAVSSSEALTVGYSAADATSGVARVDLYAQAPGQSGYAKVASDTSGSSSGSFSYTAAAGDGAYSLYTIATDRAGNVQAMPSTPNATTLLDTAAPTSKASAPSVSGSTSLTVSYTAADNPAGSGLARVDLYAQAPGQSGYTKVASDTSGSSAGGFSYVAAAGDGSYNFYTVASDTAGNVQAAPASPDATTLLDTVAPSSSASVPAISGSTSISVSYTATDSGGSGLARVDLYAQAPDQTGYTKVASDTSGSSLGSFSYTVAAGEGSYSFYTLATDRAGNVQAAPATSNVTTLFDATPPTSKASAQSVSGSTAVTVSYTAADNGGGSGLAEVDLYVQAPGQTGYVKVASDTSGSSAGSFSYIAAAGDGSYNFYTVASDTAGNVQAAPASPDATTLLDTVAPSSSASAPAISGSTSISVSYTAADSGGSGLAEVDLYAQVPGQSGYAKVASDTSGSSSGSFSYTAAAGDGAYSLYTIATDKVGNVQAAPATPDATTLLDTTPPASKASAPASGTYGAIPVSYTANDNSGGSGLARVDLYVEGPGQSSYSLTASDTSGSGSGSFSYTPSAGNGAYGFYTLATDRAGNVQAAPAAPDATTSYTLDTTPPTSHASAPAFDYTSSFTVSYSAAEDSGGSGLARVDLYAQGPGQIGYSLVASDTSASSTGSFEFIPSEGSGTYSFYTLATDKAGNVLAAPLSPDATTSVVGDVIPPTSSASSPALSASTSFSVSYTAADNNGGSELAEVDLYAQAPGQSGYSLIASDTSGNGSGSFGYTATAGDGAYNFYTVTTDKAGNVQATPSTPNATTLLDTTSPASKASAPSVSGATAIAVSYSAAEDSGGSGLARVDLYAQGPGQIGYSLIASDTSGSSAGGFSYVAAAGDGSYNFYTVATDRAGNVQAAPATPDATTLLDTTPPASKGSAPVSGTYGVIPVSYTAADNSGGSGLARVDLYVEGPGQSSYAEVASDTSGSGSGSFSYTPGAGNGSYSFYTLATDKAGNNQAAPATPDATTSYTLDTIAPTATASAPTYRNTATWTVSYTAADNAGGSGLSSVELWVRSPGTGSYAKAATNTGSSTSGSFAYTAVAGDGSYAFYTIAVDQAGNRQAPPSIPNTTTLDTVAPSAFQMANPGQYLSSNMKLSLSSAPIDSGSGMASVTYQYRASGTANAWSTACTVATSPWSCNWNTATKATPDGSYELRAVATDRAGNVTVASNTPLTGITIENTTPTAKSVSTANVSGGTTGKAQTGDSMTFTYSTTMNPASILAGWNGAATAVQVKLVAKTTKDTTLTVWSSAGTVQLALANPLDLGGNYVAASGAIFNATMVQKGAAITVTLGALTSGSVQATPVTGGTLSWTPSNGATDLAGNKCATTSTSTVGPAF
jgi:peptidoglycan/xylan/chitin deacetylase (PgdA/CDA1 family)